MPRQIDADAMARRQEGTNGLPIGAISQKSVEENEGDSGPIFEKDGFTTHCRKRIGFAKVFDYEKSATNNHANYLGNDERSEPNAILFV